MKMMDCVEVIVEKARYAKEGVHKGMQGVIFEEEKLHGYWIVLFPQYGDKEDIAYTGILEEDLKLLPNGFDAKLNERIKAQFDENGDTDKKSFDTKPDDLSGYLI